MVRCAARRVRPPFARAAAATRTTRLHAASLPHALVQGRLSRHKKIKSIDPFCKRKPVVKEPKRAFDMPPSAAELDRVPTKLKNVVFGVPKPRDDKPKPDRMFSVSLHLCAQEVVRANAVVQAMQASSLPALLLPPPPPAPAAAAARVGAARRVHEVVCPAREL